MQQQAPHNHLVCNLVAKGTLQIILSAWIRTVVRQGHKCYVQANHAVVIMDL